MPQTGSGSERLDRDCIAEIGQTFDQALFLPIDGTSIEVIAADDRCCEGFRMPAADEQAARIGGRRRKTSKGGNRGRWVCGAEACAMGI
jgi:hypothetical protein